MSGEAQMLATMAMWRQQYARAEKAEAELADLRRRLGEVADSLDKWAEWNECTVSERMERWPEGNLHRVSRPQASLRARTLIRNLLPLEKRDHVAEQDELRKQVRG